MGGGMELELEVEEMVRKVKEWFVKWSRRGKGKIWVCDIFGDVGVKIGF